MTVEPRKTECVSTTHNEQAREPLHTSCVVTCPTTFSRNRDWRMVCVRARGGRAARRRGRWRCLAADGRSRRRRAPLSACSRPPDASECGCRLRARVVRASDGGGDVIASSGARVVAVSPTHQQRGRDHAHSRTGAASMETIAEDAEGECELGIGCSRVRHFAETRGDVQPHTAIPFTITDTGSGAALPLGSGPALLVVFTPSRPFKSRTPHSPSSRNLQSSCRISSLAYTRPDGLRQRLTAAGLRQYIKCLRPPRRIFPNSRDASRRAEAPACLTITFLRRERRSVTPASLAAVGIHGIPRRGKSRGRERIVPGRGEGEVGLRLRRGATESGPAAARNNTTDVQVDLGQGFQKCSFYREQPTHSFTAEGCLCGFDSVLVRAARVGCSRPRDFVTDGLSKSNRFGARSSLLCLPLDRAWLARSRLRVGSLQFSVCVRDVCIERSLVRLLASHQGEPGSIPGRFTPDICKRGSYRTMPLVGGFSREPPVSSRPFIPALPNTHLTSPSSAVKTSLLRSRPDLFTH
ncbi:hypothetical protein PR048_015191 [Dryococelus australis]|uniref:Uncharacterized protein n=1 Tax=Dryococelus australis TaxID=614101 RepID=A0ABQ9HG91_9NEOP|nr:hypothetical protein PR048_015191 [Dryococelus australis]